MSTRQPYQQRRVVVEAIQEGEAYALCRDDTGAEVSVPMIFRVGNGGWPKEGDQWLLSMVNGTWMFFAIVGQRAPIVITTPRDAMDEGTEEIFNALLQLGLVREEPTRFSRGD